ncbi:MAG TPA: heterodisulfide reductase-related iron-sulfur binding cluster, partial [Phnomibacter sp.]|nr:heterodisulfide reductase-related iron-sulfur binding cluster [Phnomibacter sp.]
ALPVVCDFTSCTYTILKAGPQLSAQHRQKLEALKIMDSIGFIDNVVMPALPVLWKKDRVVLHPGCASTKLLLNGNMANIAGACAHHVVVPAEAGCCGMAGDRGFLFPELTEGATRYELEEAVPAGADGYYASAKTCEMALTHFSGKPYRHIAYLAEEVSRPGAH